MKPTLRKAARLTHLWLGLIGGVFVCVLAVSGAIVTLRPPLAEWMAPPRTTQTCASSGTDWARAQQQLVAFAHEPINRIYTFSGDDPRIHVRMKTEADPIFDHLIYDTCEGRVLGAISLKWMDWLVDLHHNLLAERTGRNVAGVFGIALLISAISGVLVWVLGRPDLRSAFRVRSTAGASRDWHRAIGLGAMLVLTLEAYTGLYLCYPNVMRSMVSVVAEVPREQRPPRPKKPESGAAIVPLADVMKAAMQAMPDGRVREVRIPEDYGNVQIRMWRPGDFRSLGNNVVTVSNVTGHVVGVDLYSSKTGSQRFIQAMAGLHYGEWGGLAFRWIYVAGGAATLILFATGLVIWWRPRAATARRVRVAA